MKRFLFLWMFVVCVSSAFSVELKFMGGVTFSKSSEPLGGVWIPEANPRAASLTGVSAGGGVAFSLVRYVALEVDCLYFQKGSLVEMWWNDDTLIGRDVLRLNELSFPVLLKFSLIPGTFPYLIGGAEFAFILTREPKNTDFGLVFGVGFRKQIEKTAFSIEGRYHFGVRDTSTEESSIMRKTRTVAILVGISI